MSLRDIQDKSSSEVSRICRLCGGPVAEDTEDTVCQKCKRLGKNKPHSPKDSNKIAVAVLVVISIILFILGWDNPQHQYISPNPQNQGVSKSLTTEEKIKQDITSVLGAKTNMGVKKIRGIDVVEYNGLLVNVHYNADDNLKTSMIRHGIWMDDIKVFKKLYLKYPKMKKVGMMAYFPLADKYGNTQDTLVSNIVLDKKTADKINWDNFITDSLPQVVDKIEEHNGLKT